MHDSKLISYVVSRLRDGASAESIERELIEGGCPKRRARRAVRQSVAPSGSRRKIPFAVDLVLVLIVIALSGACLVLLKNQKTSYTINLPAVPGRPQEVFAYGEEPALSDPDFFERTKRGFIEDKADFIEANLSEMRLRVYQAGEPALDVPIDSKGKEGSWWETPAGLYEVKTKEKEHFSGMGHVWMPWSLNFQGNFYIHGRTYYPDGTLTSTQFTGGCIRLLTEDARKVFDLARAGMPVLVFESGFSSDDYAYEEVGPALSAKAYLAADLRNNHVFSNKDNTQALPIASITKLMTALVAAEYINLDGIATVPKDAIVYTSKPRLEPGQKASVYQLLFPLLMESSNEAAETIARFYGRDAFIRHMNEKAASLGMSHTAFADPSGASAENVSTADDLFILAKYIYNNRSFIFNITSGKVKNSAYGSSGFDGLQNLNDFVGSEHFFGGKNGQTTAARETNISVFELPVSEGVRPVTVIVLGSDDRKKDSEALLEYTLEHFR